MDAIVKVKLYAACDLWNMREVKSYWWELGYLWEGLIFIVSVTVCGNIGGLRKHVHEFFLFLPSSISKDGPKWTNEITTRVTFDLI